MSYIGKRLAWALIPVVVLIMSQAVGARVANQSLDFDGVTRTYEVHVPGGYDGKHALPLLLAFHGGGGTGFGMKRLTKLDICADKHGFLVCYPDGLHHQWNDGRKGSATADDTGFINALIDNLKSTYNIDSSRIYAAGISNGGFFSQHLACALSHKIAAVASVAASVPESATCAARRAVPIIFFLGDEDPLVPYNGGDMKMPFARAGSATLRAMPKRFIGGKVLSAEQSALFWVRHNGCDPHPASQWSEPLPHGLRVECTTYTASAIGECVVLYSIFGGGHTWPGGMQYLPAAIVGHTAKTLDANEIIWQFFSKHRLD